jgi:hypothetical protein
VTVHFPLNPQVGHGKRHRKALDCLPVPLDVPAKIHDV